MSGNAAQANKAVAKKFLQMFERGDPSIADERAGKAFRFLVPSRFENFGKTSEKVLAFMKQAVPATPCRSAFLRHRGGDNGIQRV